MRSLFLFFGKPSKSFALFCLARPEDVVLVSADGDFKKAQKGSHIKCTGIGGYPIASVMITMEDVDKNWKDITVTGTGVARLRIPSGAEIRNHTFTCLAQNRFQGASYEKKKTAVFDIIGKFIVTPRLKKCP